MSAEVESMAWSGEVPWHGLGVEVGDDLTPGQILKRASLDWTVSKRPIFTTQKTSDDKDFRMQGSVKIEDRFALTRDSDTSVLDIVGPKYVPVQNSNAFDFFSKFVKEGKMKMHTAGSLMGGQYVWALAELDHVVKVGRGDDLESYLLMMSPHKHGKSLIAQFTSVRVVCWNTLNMALGSSLAGSKTPGKHFRMPHIREFDDNVKKDAMLALGLMMKQSKEMGDLAKHLAGVKVSDKQADDFFKKLLKLDPESLEQRKKEDEAQAEAESSRVLQMFRAALQTGPGADLTTAKGTAWGALNAVTFVVDHKLGYNRDQVVRDLWMGYRGSMKRDAVKQIAELV